MNKQKEVEHVIKKHMKFKLTKDEFTLQGDKVYDLAQEIVKLFAIPVVSGSTSKCECKKEWLSHSTEYNVHPYGDNIEYDKCQKCGKTHNFKTF